MRLSHENTRLLVTFKLQLVPEARADAHLLIQYKNDHHLKASKEDVRQ
jgi:hypothetical protein